jgi:putative ABC transport system substrate-binding protein
MRLIALVVVGMLAIPLVADTQQARKVSRIGFLGHGQPSPRMESFLAAFRQGMHEHGYLEGQHYVMENRWMGSKPREQFSASVVELVRLPVDLLLATGLRSALIAKQVTTTVPIVVAMALNPVELGLIESLSHPGGNVTGVAYPAGRAIVGKELELLRDLAPQLSSVAFVYNANNPVVVPYIAPLKEAADELDLMLHLVAIRGSDDVDTALGTLIKEKVGGLLVYSDTEIMAERRRLIAFADEQRLPTIWGSERAVNDGALISYGANLPDMWRRAATYVARILKGEKPADLPMERADRIDLTINLKTAERRGITIPPILLVQATKVIR